MTAAVPDGQRVCYPQTAWISGLDRRFGVLVTQASCGGSVYVHEWLERSAPKAAASWRVVTQRSGTIDRPAGCTRSASVPADIRCL